MTDVIKDIKAVEDALDDFGIEKITFDGREKEGPYDISEVTGVRPYIDFGSIRILPREGLSVKLDVEESSKRIISITLDYASSSLQLQAYASPKSTGLWSGMLKHIAENLESQGASLSLSNSYFGPELLASFGTGIEKKEIIFCGVDGPRWTLRAMISGNAIFNVTARKAINDIFKSVVVVRGDLPIPPKDLLLLKAPTAINKNEESAFVSRD